MADIDKLKREWQRESAHLKDLEDRVSRAWSDFATGTGSAPTSEMLLELSVARRESDARLQALLASMTVSPTPNASPPPAAGESGHPTA